VAFVILIAGPKNLEAAVSANDNNLVDTDFLIVQDCNLWCRILICSRSLTDN